MHERHRLLGAHYEAARGQERQLAKANDAPSVAPAIEG
jgi:hypothetical protein